MTVNTHRKGSRWRRAVEEWFRGKGFKVTVRGIGFSGDDVVADLGQLHFSLECKSVASIDLAGFVDQAERQAPADLIPVVMLHRRGRASVDDGYVVMSGAAFARLIAGIEDQTEVGQLALWP